MKVLTTRVSEKVMADLGLVEEIDKADRAMVVRKLLDEGLREWKMRFALEKLRKREFSIGKAAETAGIPYSAMMDAMAGHGIDVGYEKEDLERDFREIKKGKRWQ